MEHHVPASYPSRYRQKPSLCKITERSRSRYANTSHEIDTEPARSWLAMAMIAAARTPVNNETQDKPSSL